MQRVQTQRTISLTGMRFHSLQDATSSPTKLSADVLRFDVDTARHRSPSSSNMGDGTRQEMEKVLQCIGPLQFLIDGRADRHAPTDPASRSSDSQRDPQEMKVKMDEVDTNSGMDDEATRHQLEQ